VLVTPPQPCRTACGDAGAPGRRPGALAFSGSQRITVGRLCSEGSMIISRQKWHSSCDMEARKPELVIDPWPLSAALHQIQPTSPRSAVAFAYTTGLPATVFCDLQTLAGLDPNSRWGGWAPRFWRTGSPEPPQVELCSVRGSYVKVSTGCCTGFSALALFLIPAGSASAHAHGVTQSDALWQATTLESTWRSYVRAAESGPA
jgi:hypothetical protein